MHNQIEQPFLVGGGVHPGAGIPMATLCAELAVAEMTRRQILTWSPPNGYAWWYVDGVDPTSGRAISIIAFIGSVFSPWYKWSGRREPQNNVCINVATYGPGGRFTMTDRGRSALRQSEHSFTVGPSSLVWDPIEQTLTINVNEISSPPIISRVRAKSPCGQSR